MSKSHLQIVPWVLGAGLTLFFLKSFFGGEGGVEILTESSSPTSGWPSGDVVGYKVTYLDPEGAGTGQFGYGAFRVSELSPFLHRATRNLGVGGVGRVTVRHGDFSEARGESDIKYAEVEVLFRIPAGQVVESFASDDTFPLETGVLVLDHSGSGSIDVLGGRPWQKKNSWYLDSSSCRPFSMDGGKRRLWEWLGPKSGYLVLKVDGKIPDDITGGDLVGTGTGGQDWGSAYEVLAHLDTDKNGWVDGDELDVLGFWVDSNIDGVSESWEVSEARGLFHKISTRFSNDQYMARYNPEDGATLKDGREVGSWEFWPRGETHPGGYLGRRGSENDKFVRFDRKSEGDDKLDVHSKIFVFNVCAKTSIDTMAGLGGGGISTRSVALTPSGSSQADPEGRWEWVGPCSGILVLPEIVGADRLKISEYIYGSNTGGQPWNNSYEALRFLDADNNGWVEGDELSRIAVWVDRGGDGKPDPWEVKPAASTISKVSVSPSRGIDGELSVDGEGVVFLNNTSSPSWCWRSKKSR